MKALRLDDTAIFEEGRIEMSPFFFFFSRMKYIERWALMRNSRPENLSEHAAEVAMIAHALCVIGNVRYNRGLNAERAALIGLYHDASEIITGDMPTPVKYYNDDMKKAYKEVENAAEQRLLDKLPDDLRHRQPVLIVRLLHENLHEIEQFQFLVRSFSHRKHLFRSFCCV